MIMNYPQRHRDGYRFRVWAPEKETMILRLLPGRDISMNKDEWGYFTADIPGTEPATRYGYLVDGNFFPDPCSGYQPEGVYGASEFVDHGAYAWRDGAWRGKPFAT